jgi:2-iminobutanoate/2-iminopropanoate deaminase
LVSRRRLIEGGSLSIERVEKRVISSQEAPDWPEPIAAAVEWQGLVFASGELGVDPETMRPVGPGVGDQTRQALANLSATLRAAGSSLAHVLKVNAFLDDPDDYEEFNRVFGEEFPELPPARTTVGVQLLGGYAVEIDLVAYVPRDTGHRS